MHAVPFSNGNLFYRPLRLDHDVLVSGCIAGGPRVWMHVGSPVPFSPPGRAACARGFLRLVGVGGARVCGSGHGAALFRCVARGGHGIALAVRGCIRTGRSRCCARDGPSESPDRFRTAGDLRVSRGEQHSCGVGVLSAHVHPWSTGVSCGGAVLLFGCVFACACVEGRCG